MKTLKPAAYLSVMYCKPGKGHLSLLRLHCEYCSCAEKCGVLDRKMSTRSLHLLLPLEGSANLMG